MLKRAFALGTSWTHSGVLRRDHVRRVHQTGLVYALEVLLVQGMLLYTVQVMRLCQGKHHQADAEFCTPLMHNDKTR